MTNFLSFLLLLALVLFGISVNNNINQYKADGAKNIQVDFIKGSICGRFKDTLGCDSLYTLKIED